MPTKPTLSTVQAYPENGTLRPRCARVEAGALEIERRSDDVRSDDVQEACP
jgi:hypothetical protein